MRKACTWAWRRGNVKTCDTPVEALEDTVSDRSSTLLASTTIRLKSLFQKNLGLFSAHFKNKKGFDPLFICIPTINFFVPTIYDC